jgi:hypothetical protein
MDGTCQSCKTRNKHQEAVKGPANQFRCTIFYDGIKPSLRGELKTVPASSYVPLFFDFNRFEHPVPATRESTSRQGGPGSRKGRDHKGNALPVSEVFVSELF